MSLDELQRIQRLKQQMREQERARFADPSKDYDLERVWVAHVWAPSDNNGTGEWLFAGFRRRRNRRKPQTMNRFFSKVRRQLGLQKGTHVMLMDLNEAQQRFKQIDQSWRTRPPQFQQRKAPMAQREATLWVTTHSKQRAKTKALKLDKKETKFIVLCRNPWDRKPGYLYGGPLSEIYFSNAVREAARKFPIYKERLVIKTSDLSKSLRGSMHRGRKVRAGVTRIIWPEVPPTFDAMWAKYLKKNEPKIAAHVEEGWVESSIANVRDFFEFVWMCEGEPWLTIGWIRKQVQLYAPSSGESACAIPANDAKIIERTSIAKRKPIAKHRRSASRRAVR